ncbi:MAG: hypothetical protein HC877_15800 [Thioploca sp.]|nr:hypothetical protein [Thioploca sp.]
MYRYYQARFGSELNAARNVLAKLHDREIDSLDLLSQGEVHLARTDLATLIGAAQPGL